MIIAGWSRYGGTGQRVRLSGFKPEIDAINWLIEECRHSMDADPGLQTKLKMETAIYAQDASNCLR